MYGVSVQQYMSIMVENMKDAINFEQKLTTGTT
jgi:hypothetical protein